MDTTPYTSRSFVLSWTTAEGDGYVETLMGRRRRLGEMFKTGSYRDVARGSRLAMNSSIQGQSSDAGMIGVFSFLQYLLDNKLERRWLIQNVVHDSCLIQVPVEDIEKALPVIQHYFVIGMSDYIARYFKFILPLPIECEIEIGLKYGDLTKWDGRPSTLPKIIEELKEKAKKLWSEKKEVLPAFLWVKVQTAAVKKYGYAVIFKVPKASRS